MKAHVKEPQVEVNESSDNNLLNLMHNLSKRLEESKKRPRHLKKKIENVMSKLDSSPIISKYDNSKVKQL